MCPGGRCLGPLVTPREGKKPVGDTFWAHSYLFLDELKEVAPGGDIRGWSPRVVEGRESLAAKNADPPLTHSQMDSSVKNTQNATATAASGLATALTGSAQQSPSSCSVYLGAR